MNSTTARLLEAAKLYAGLLRIDAERKRQQKLREEKERNDKTIALQSKNSAIAHERVLHAAQVAVAALENEIAIQERRKQSIASIGSKKMQEKALGEIRISLKKLNEDLAKEKNILAEHESRGASNTASTEPVVDSFLDLEPEEKLSEREALYRSDYQKLLSEVSPQEKAIFESVLKKCPMDPLVVIKEGNCGGCFTRVLPPLLAKVQLESGICRCDDCGRILFNVNNG